MIHGETVYLIERRPTGRDALNCTTYTESNPIEVRNVLIGSPSADGNPTGTNIEGAKTAFTLGIPKGDTHEWEYGVVYIRGERYRTYGRPLRQTEANVPTPWNLQVKVERYE